MQVIDQYLSSYFYELTWLVLVPLLGFINLPLNALMIKYLYMNDDGVVIVGSCMFYSVLVGEIISLLAQIGLGYYILLSPAGIYLIRYNSVFWKYTYAALLYCALLFLTNDGSKLLMIVYMNQMREAAKPNNKKLTYTREKLIIEDQLNI